MQVRALRAGFYGGDLKTVGEVFSVATDHNASWFVPIAEQVAEPVKQTQQSDLGKPRRGRPPSSGLRPSASPDTAMPTSADPDLP